MEIHALAAGVRIPPRKARLVAATVIGLPVNEALTVLAFTPRAAAVDVAKVIRSAAANAEHNYELSVDDLRVARIEVDGARTIKRFRPRAQGRAFSIMKRTCHMRAVVTDEAVVTDTPARRRTATPAAPAPTAKGRRAAEAQAPASGASRAARVAGARARQKPAVTDPEASTGTVEETTPATTTAPTATSTKTPRSRKAAAPAEPAQDPSATEAAAAKGQTDAEAEE